MKKTKVVMFEKSKKTDKEMPKMKEGSKMEKMLDKKQMSKKKK